MRILIALTAALMLAGCGTAPTQLTLSQTKTTVRAQATQGREAAYQAVKEHFLRYGRIFSQQIGVEGPVWAFSVAVGPDATDKVRYNGTYDERTGKITIESATEIGGGR